MRKIAHSARFNKRASRVDVNPENLSYEDSLAEHDDDRDTKHRLPGSSSDPIQRLFDKIHIHQILKEKYPGMDAAEIAKEIGGDDREVKALLTNLLENNTFYSYY